MDSWILIPVPWLNFVPPPSFENLAKYRHCSEIFRYLHRYLCRKYPTHRDSVYIWSENHQTLHTNFQKRSGQLIISRTTRIPAPQFGVQYYYGPNRSFIKAPMNDEGGLRTLSAVETGIFLKLSTNLFTSLTFFRWVPKTPDSSSTVGRFFCFPLLKTPYWKETSLLGDLSPFQFIPQHSTTRPHRCFVIRKAALWGVPAWSFPCLNELR